jgi:hypothetical protein
MVIMVALAMMIYNKAHALAHPFFFSGSADSVKTHVPTGKPIKKAFMFGILHSWSLMTTGFAIPGFCLPPYR